VRICRLALRGRQRLFHIRFQSQPVNVIIHLTAFAPLYSTYNSPKSFIYSRNI
jgi:hypothetical protein